LKRPELVGCVPAHILMEIAAAKLNNSLGYYYEHIVGPRGFFCA